MIHYSPTFKISFNMFLWFLFSEIYLTWRMAISSNYTLIKVFKLCIVMSCTWLSYSNHFSDHSRPLFSKLLFQRFLWMSMFWHAPEFQGCRVGCEIRLLACNNRLILLQKILIKEVLHFFSKWRVMALKIYPVPKVLVFKGYFVLWFCPQPCQHN